MTTDNESDKVCVEDDGCPTEMAVLKRFWREHHNPSTIDTTDYIGAALELEAQRDKVKSQTLLRSIDRVLHVLNMANIRYTNNTPVIDLDVLAWESIKKAASESTWMPKEYYANDWHSDVCEWLRNGPPKADNVLVVSCDNCGTLW